ncbi:MAG: AAA family ATPase, partial [Candidatus Omnitrophica bacterium]|nr:AAA family ATPase [Candidatus Omnitrophota bacterium]
VAGGTGIPVIGAMLKMGFWYNLVFAGYNLIPLTKISDGYGILFGKEKIEEPGIPGWVLVASGVAGLLIGLPAVIGPCYLMDWYEIRAREEQERLEAAKKDKKETESIKKDIEKSTEELDDLIDEMSEEMEEEPSDLKTNLKSESVKHDFFKYLQIGAGNYFKFTKKEDRNFNDFLEAIVRILKEKVFKNEEDTPDRIRAYLTQGKIRKTLQKIYDKEDREITYGKYGTPDREHEMEPAASAVLRQLLDTQGLTDHHHDWDDHGTLGGHSAIIIAFMLAGASVLCKLAFGWDMGVIMLIPVVAGVCGCMAYSETVTRQKQDDLKAALEKQDREATKQIQKDIKDAVEEHRELIETLEEEVLDAEEAQEFTLNLRSDRARTDFVKYITLATVDYFKSTEKGDRTFEDFIDKVIELLKASVFKNSDDTPDKIRKLLLSDTLRPLLEKIYKNADRDIVYKPAKPEVREPLQSEVLKAVVSQTQTTGLEASEGAGKGFLGGGTSTTVILFILAGASLAMRLLLGWDTDLFLGALVAGVAVNGNGQAEEEPPEEIIKKYASDLDKLAEAGKIDDTYYVDEIGAIDAQAENNDANNFLLVGDPTLAQGAIEAAVARKQTLKTFKDARFFEIDTAQFVDSLAVPGMLDNVLKKLITAIQTEADTRHGRSVVVLNFRDYVETPMITGRGGKNIDMVYSQLSRAIRSKNVSVIIITPPALHEKTLSKTGKYDDNFMKIDLTKPREYDVRRIARSYVMKINTLYKDRLPDGVKVRVERSVIEETLEAIGRYYTGTFAVTKFQELTDRIIIEEFSRGDALRFELDDVRRRLMLAGQALSVAIRAGRGREETDFLEVTLDRLQRRYQEIREALKAYETRSAEIIKAKKWDITFDRYEEMIARDLDVPVDEIRKTEGKKLEEYVGVMAGSETEPDKKPGMLIGQGEVIRKSHLALLRRQGTGDRGKNVPKWAALLVGPTGVGKTEFVRSLGRHFFGSEDAVIRFDMTEYMLEQEAQKLFGPPPGYVGYEEGGQLTEKVRRKPYSIVLLDEIEKAHESVFNTLLQILDKGELTDNRGRVTSFKNTIIIMTSNVGFSEIAYSEKERDKNFEAVQKNIDEIIAACNGDVSAGDIWTALDKLFGRSKKLQAEIARRGKTDPDLEAEIKEMDDLFFEADRLASPTAKDERRKALLSYLTAMRASILQARKHTIQEIYGIIAKYKDLIMPDEADAQPLGQEIDTILRTEKAGLRWIMQDAIKDPDNKEYKEHLDQYIMLCEVLSRDTVDKRVQGLLDYFRWIVKKMLINTIREDPDISKKFKPELLGRIGVSDIRQYDPVLKRDMDISNLISFDPLSTKDLERILDIKIREINALLADEGFGNLLLGPALRKRVIEKGYDVTNGARPLERAIRAEVLAGLAEEILAGRLKRRQDIYADLFDGRLGFECRERQDSQAGQSTSEMINNIRAASAEAEPVPEEKLTALLGLESPAKPEERRAGKDMDALKKRLEVDVPTPDLGIDPDILSLSVAEVDKRLKKVTEELKTVSTESERLNTQLNATPDLQQKQAIGRELMKREALRALLTRRKALLEARKQGRTADIQAILEEAQRQQDAEAEKARKEINDCFENLTLRFHREELKDSYPPAGVIDRLTGILMQKKRNYPMLVDRSTIVQAETIDSMAYKMADGAIPGFSGTRVLRLDLAGLREYLSVVGFFEIRMKEIADVIAKDDAAKGLKTVIVVDFDEVRTELERLRVNPFMLGYFLRLFKGYETLSFVMTTSRASVTQDDMFDQFFSLVEVPEQDRNAILENFYLFMRNTLTKGKTGDGGKPVEISFEAMKMALRVWDQYFSGIYAPGKFRRWFNTLVSRTVTGTSGGRVVLNGKLETLAGELGYLCQELLGEEISYEKLALRPEIRA